MHYAPLHRMRRAAALCCALIMFAPTNGRTETVRLGASTPVASLGHPFAEYTGGGVKSSVYDALTQITSDGVVKGSLAQTWEISGPTTWQFKLRQDVTFHNGKAFNADAVVEVFRYLKSDEGKTFAATRDIKSIAGVRTISPFVVEFETHTPDSILDRRLSNISMVEMEAWHALGADAYARNPIGTGPYTVVEWGPATSHIILEVHKESWRQPAAVDRVEMVMIPDATARLQALTSGVIDVTINLDPDTRAAVEATGIRTIDRKGPMVLALPLRTIGMPDSPLLDKRVRQALNYAVDKQTIKTYLLDGLMEVASQVVTPSVVGYNPDINPYAFDPERAKTLLQEAGYGDGFDMEIAVFSGQVPGDTLIFQKVSQDLEAVGVNVELRRLPYSEFSRRFISGDWGDMESYATVWSSIKFHDAMYVIERFFACDSVIPFFCSEDLMPQIQAARTELDQNVRTQLLQSIIAELHELAPSIVLFEYADIVALHPKIKRYVSRSDGILFDEMLIEE